MTRSLLFPFLFILFYCIVSPEILFAQGEMQTHENGLIYSSKAMDRLYFIADSLNVRFRKCDIRPTWTSFEQGYGFSYYESDSVKIHQLLDQLYLGASRKEFETIKYPGEPLSADTSLVLRYTTFNADSGKKQITYAELGDWDIISNYETASPEHFKRRTSSDGGIWYWFIGKSRYSDKVVLDIYYLIHDYQSYALPKKYSDWINYSQCMVDTNTRVYLPDAKHIGSYWRSQEECQISEAQRAFLEKIEAIHFNEPEPRVPGLYRGLDEEEEKKNQEEFDVYNQKLLVWQRRRQDYIMSELSKDPDFPALAEEAWTKAKDSDCFTEEFVDLLGTYYSPSKALDLKRARIKVGMCSMDSSPRFYLAQIALLAAEAGRWEVFLRSHLNLMNDRVSRNSDNSGAERYRGVYIKELEALPLDLKQLFPGMIFRINNAPSNHYYNTLTRSAKSMALSRDPAGFYQQLLGVISDPSVDPFNRVIFAHVASNLFYYLDEEQKAAFDRCKIADALTDLPQFLVERFNEEEEEEED